VDDTGVERLKTISAVIEQGGPAPSETVRSLLSWFGAQRRGYLVVAVIQAALDRAGLTTEPDFESAFIDSHIQFRPKPKPGGDQLDPPLSTSTSAHAEAGADHSASSAGYSDPSFRLSKLAAANNIPVSVKPDATLAEAVTIMLSRDYSQLPVMPNERDVKGAISWRSIATRLSLGRQGTAVREFMDTVDILPSDASLFDAIRHIVDKQYVLVQAPDRRVVGIVTSSDLSVQFQSLTEPFLLLSELENDIRRVLQDKFSPSELAASKDPGDTTREINSVHDMNFGEYIALLERTENWKRLGLQLDRRSFIDQLKQVRDVRNDVMHFDPDGIPPEDLAMLRDFSKFMQRLRDLGVT
jgi:CBS domain-containing protein